MDKRLLLALAIVAALTLLTAGCCGPVDDIIEPKPCPTITTTFKPTPTPRPTIKVTPTPTPEPTIIQQRASKDVKLLAAPYEYQCRFIRNERGQSENLTILLVNNNDTTTARKVILVVTVEDYAQGTVLFSGDLEFGDLAPGEQRLVQVITPPHEMASPVYIKISIEWGEYREFYYRDAYKNSFTYISSAVFP